MHSKNSYKCENSENLTQSRTHDQHNPSWLSNQLCYYFRWWKSEDRKYELKVHEKWMCLYMPRQMKLQRRTMMCMHAEISLTMHTCMTLNSECLK